nr:hypothetical protein [Tanacetum cinerariifolium]
MTTPNVTSSTDSQMHNNIMAAGSRDRPPMLAPVQAVKATDDSPAVPEHTTVETLMNMSPENKAYFLAEKEAIHLILTVIGDDIYSTVDACQTAQEMWEAIERLQHGESLNIQDVNIQFLQQLQPEWSRFMTIVKQQHKLDEVSFDKLFDILKQYQNEVNELHAKKLARNANPLALVATAQADRDQYYQTSRHKVKEIAKPITPPSETASEEDSDPEQAQRDKDIQKNLALIAKYFKKIYKPTNNNLRTSSNSKNKNVDTTPRENVGSKVVQQSGIQCFNCKEYRHFAKECRKPKRVKDSAYHKEKMLLCKQAEQGILLQAEHYDWLADTDEEVDEQELEAHYSYMAKIQENEQNDVESDDERVALPNLKLDVNENKKIQKQLKKTKQAEFDKFKAFNDRTIDYDKLESKLNEALEQLAHKDTVIREGLVKQKTKVIMDLKLTEEHDIDKMLSMEKQLRFLNKIVYKRSQSIQTIHMMAPKVPTYNGRPTFANPRYLKQAQSEIPCLYVFPYDQNTHANRLILDGEETLVLERESRSKLNKVLVCPYDYTTLNSLYEIFKPPTQEYETQLAHANEIRKKMWRKSFVKSKPNIYKNVGFLPVSKSISKNQFRAPTAQDMEILIQTCLMPLAIKTHSDSLKFVHELKQEMHVDLKYVETLEKEIDELEYEKAEFSDMYDMILQECVSNDVKCSYLQSLSNLDALSELQCMYLHKTMSISKANVSEGLSKPVTVQTLPQTAKKASNRFKYDLPFKPRWENDPGKLRATPDLLIRDCSCSKGSVEDKILVPKPPENCASTNVVNAPRELFVVKQDHGVNPPHIDECCCECGEALDGIICQRCACKSCGKGAHIGYNCPPKIPIISNPEPCNQTMNNERPQTLPSFDSTCYSDKEISVPRVSKPNFVNESSNIFNPPPQPPIYSCEVCGSNAQNGHYCTPQAPFINPEPGSVDDKILVPKPPENCARCAKCGHPFNGPYCQGCILLREKLEEDLVTYFQKFLNTSESSDSSTNIVNAPREPFVVKQDHGVNPPHIDECCCKCGEALDGIICQRCACKSCGKGAHIGYNCPPTVLIISNLEQCNQTMNNEPPQTLPNFDSTCYSDKEISVPCVSKPNFVDESSNIFIPPPQPPIYFCEFCGSNAQYGHYCTPQAPFINPEPGTVEDKILVPKPPKNRARCTRCGYLVDGPHCQGCPLLRQELEEILFTLSPDFQNTSEPSNASTNIVNAPREPYVVKQDNGSSVDKIIFYLNRVPDSPNQFHCFHCKDVLRDGEACKRCTCTKCRSGLSKELCYICGHNQNSLNDSPRISETYSLSHPNINHCCYECGDPLDGIFCKRCTCKFCGKDAHIGYNCPSKVSVISIPEPCNNQTIDELP